MPASPDEDQILLDQLNKEEADLLEARAHAVKASLSQSVREVERLLEGVRRAIPELDIVSKTSGELRTSIRKTMERADIVSVKVRELDLSRSRALEALEYANQCLAARTCVQGAKRALENKDVEVAAQFVKEFDLVVKPNPFTTEMLKIRNDLERIILFSPNTVHKTATTLDASREDWLQSDAIKEALKQASVMSKVSDQDSHSAESRFALFLGGFLKERMHAYLAVENRLSSHNAKAFMEAFKYLFNSTGALLESNTVRIPEQVLPKSARPVIFKAIHSECDRQCTQLFDTFLSTRRIHERCAQLPVPTEELTALNQLLVEVCICMQHVETYERFVKSLLLSPHDTLNDSEYRRVLQEVAGAYTILERNYLIESLKRAKQAEQSISVSWSQDQILPVSSLVEDGFYLSKRALKRAMGTGSSDAACGCINQIAACLEDALFFPSDLEINSLELSTKYAEELHTLIGDSIVKSFQREDAKVRASADGILDLGRQWTRKRLEGIRNMIVTGKYFVYSGLGEMSYQLDETQFAALEGDDSFATKVLAQIHGVLAKDYSLSEQSVQLLCESLSLFVTDEWERAVVQKRFSQLGALRFERDLRDVAEGIARFATSGVLGVRKMFSRLFQIASLLSISQLNEAHDVWDSFQQQQQQQQQHGSQDSSSLINPKEGLTAKEAKRILALRVDFDQREVQKMKLI